MGIESDIFKDGIIVHDGLGAMTIFDLDRIPEGLDQEGIKQYLHATLKKETIDLDFIGDLYDSAIEYMQNRLFYTEQELGNYKGKVFASIDDIIEFIAFSRNSRGRMNCSICKIVLGFLKGGSVYNPRIDEVREKTARVVEGKLIPPLQIIEHDKKLEIYNGVVQIGDKSISFTMRKRIKTDESRISKGVRDPAYHEQELLSDGYGVTFELDNKEDIPVFMEYVADRTFKRGKYDIKQKNMFSRDDIEGMKGISDDFKKRLLNAGGTKKDQTSDDYSDIKIVTPYYTDDETKNMSMEIKFVTSNNNNERGLAMQGVYDYFKRIEERIRLEAFVKPEYISHVVGMFFYDIKEILSANIGREDKDIQKYKTELFQGLREKGFINGDLDLRNSSTRENLDIYLISGLVGYYKNMLRPVKVEGLRTEKIFYTLSRALSISELGIWKNRLIPQN